MMELREQLEQLKNNVKAARGWFLVSINITIDLKISYSYSYGEDGTIFHISLSDYSHDRSIIYKILSKFEEEFRKRLE